MHLQETFYRSQSDRPRAVICGGGHISLAVCRILNMIDFQITVIDDRPEFAGKERFPEADEVICDSFEQVLKEHSFGANTYFIIVTRGHQYDYVCLKEILKLPSKYVGMIGSKAKIQMTMKKLRETDEVSEEKLAFVKAPIGLKIGAVTPEEIAVCIVAEIIMVKRSGADEGFYLSQAVAQALNSGTGGVLITVVEQKGSSPGKTGSHMFIDTNGKVAGTIGGGAVEYQALAEGQKCLANQENKVVEYNLSNDTAANLGMVCGGRIKVSFEMIGKGGVK